MEESSIYQEIVRVGETRGIRDTILRQGRIKFGKPSRQVAVRLDRIDDVEKLHALADRLIQAESWDQLLAAE